MKNLLTCLIMALTFSLSAQTIEHYPLDVTGSVSDTFNLRLNFGHHGTGVIAFSDLALDGNTANIRAHGSIDGDTWYSIFLCPGSSGVPTLTAIVIDSENAVFMPQRGIEGVSVERPFRYLRFITDVTGVGNTTARYKFMYADTN